MLDAAAQLILRVPKATLDILGAYAEDLFRAILGLELDCGKLWRRKSLGTGVYQPEDPWEVRERLLVHQPEDPWPEDPWEVRERLRVYQPEDPWEVRERLFRRFRGVSVTAGGFAEGSRVEDRACSTLLHRLVLRVPKATLDILRACAEDLFRVLDAASQTCFTGSESNVRHSEKRC